MQHHILQYVIRNNPVAMPHWPETARQRLRHSLGRGVGVEDGVGGWATTPGGSNVGSSLRPSSRRHDARGRRYNDHAGHGRFCHLRGLWARFHARTVGGPWRSAFHRPTSTPASRRGVSDSRAQQETIQPRRKNASPTASHRNTTGPNLVRKLARFDPACFAASVARGCFAAVAIGNARRYRIA